MPGMEPKKNSFKNRQNTFNFGQLKPEKKTASSMYGNRTGTALGKAPIDPIHGFPEHFPPGTHCNRSRGKSILGSHESGLWGFPRAFPVRLPYILLFCHPFVPARPVYFHPYVPVQARAQSRPVRSPVLQKQLLVYTTIAKSPRLENLNPYIYDGRASRSSSKPFREDPQRDES